NGRQYSDTSHSLIFNQTAMKISRNWFWKVSGSFAFAVFYMGFIGYTAEHWPSGYQGLRFLLIGALGVCFLWLFVLRPFRSGFKGEPR
ncbi:MAG TPA: hypothetical protein VIV82_08000, partial [Verrucomicrobiae bacterium]